MGRKRIEIRKIEDDRRRQITFQKRKFGLFKKAIELSMLCDCEMGIVIFGFGKLYQYANKNMGEVLARYHSLGGQHAESITNNDYHLFEEKKEPKRGRKKAAGSDDDSGNDAPMPEAPVAVSTFPAAGDAMPSSFQAYNHAVSPNSLRPDLGPQIMRMGNPLSANPAMPLMQQDGSGLEALPSASGFGGAGLFTPRTQQQINSLNDMDGMTQDAQYPFGTPGPGMAFDIISPGNGLSPGPFRALDPTEPPKVPDAPGATALPISASSILPPPSVSDSGAVQPGKYKKPMRINIPPKAGPAGAVGAARAAATVVAAAAPGEPHPAAPPGPSLLSGLPSGLAGLVTPFTGGLSALTGGLGGGSLLSALGAGSGGLSALFAPGGFEAALAQQADGGGAKPDAIIPAGLRGGAPPSETPHSSMNPLVLPLPSAIAMQSPSLGTPPFAAALADLSPRPSSLSSSPRVPVDALAAVSPARAALGLADPGGTDGQAKGTVGPGEQRGSKREADERDDPAAKRRRTE